MVRRILGFLLGLLLASQAWAADLSIVADEEKKGGYLIEVTLAALKRVGYEARVQYCPWQRALYESMEAGAHDILLGAYSSPERRLKMAYSEPLGKVDICLFSLKSRRISYRSLRDLEPYRIGVVRGAMISEAFQGAGLKCEAVSTVEQNLAKLLAGRIDLFVDKEYTTLHLLRGAFLAQADRVEALRPPLRSDHFYNAFPKRRPGSQKLLEDFNRGLRLVKEDGSYAAILRRCTHE